MRLRFFSHLKQLFADENSLVYFPIFIYILLILPFLNVIPFLDGNIDFLKSYQFYIGGFEYFFTQWTSVHPPLKMVLQSILFSLFGITPFASNILGHSFAVFGIYAFYKLIQKYSSSEYALLGTFCLVTQPLFLSTSIFGMNDFLLLHMLIMCLYFYFVKKNIFLTSIFLAFAVLMKETALIFAVLFLLTEIFSCLWIFYKKRTLSLNFIWLLIPFVVFFGWEKFIEVHGQQSWNDWNFSEYSSKGGMYTIVAQLLHLSFWHKYTQAHWMQFFILNFQWVKSLIFAVSFFGIARALLKIRIISKHSYQIYLFVGFIGVLFLSYVFTVLTFPTYTIPRYAVPLVPMFIIIFILFIHFGRISKKLKYILIGIFLSTNILGLFGTFDPISQRIWGTISVFGYSLYDLPSTTAGNDGIMYNLDFGRVSLIRSAQMKSAKGKVISQDCFWVFPNEENERKTNKILGLQIDPKAMCATE